MRIFWKIIEYIYVNTEFTKFSTKDVRAYKEGKLAVNHKELVGFFWNGIVLGDLLIVIAILEVAIALIYGVYYAIAFVAVLYDVAIAFIAIRGIVLKVKEKRQR